MNLILQRQCYRRDGIFGELWTEDRQIIAVTLEHAYGNGNYVVPKIPAGHFTCIRGMHRLSSMAHDFQTFEIVGIPGHRDILFHAGNFNDDSAGCVLLGTLLNNKNPREWFLQQSKMAFNHFLDLEKGIDTFTLEVKG